MQTFRNWFENLKDPGILWLVVDAGPESTIDDILVPFDLANPRSFANYIFGSISPDKFMAEHPKFHQSKDDAYRDAEQRLLAAQGNINYPRA